MPHKVEISDKTFERLKEYCSENDLKIGQFADKLIFDGLMIEMYGDVPFTNYRKPPQEIKQIPLQKEIIEKFPPEKFEEEYMQQPGPITEEMKKRYEDMDEVERMTRRREKEKEEAEEFKRSIREAIAEGEEQPKVTMDEETCEIDTNVNHTPSHKDYYIPPKTEVEEKLKQAGVPTKVVNKITRRRLK